MASFPFFVHPAPLPEHRSAYCIVFCAVSFFFFFCARLLATACCFLFSIDRCRLIRESVCPFLLLFSQVRGCRQIGHAHLSAQRVPVRYPLLLLYFLFFLSFLSFLSFFLSFFLLETVRGDKVQRDYKMIRKDRGFIEEGKRRDK